MACIPGDNPQIQFKSNRDAAYDLVVRYCHSFGTDFHGIARAYGHLQAIVAEVLLRDELGEYIDVRGLIEAKLKETL